MAKRDITLDSGGIAEMLRSTEVAGVINSTAANIAGHVRAALAAKNPPVDVHVDAYRTDRAAASVTIRDVRGKIYQARDGILTRAAAAAGLEVRSRT